MDNPEGLTRKEILFKIEHLEKSIRLCLIRSGERYCKNRIKRVRLLKSYL